MNLPSGLLAIPRGRRPVGTVATSDRVAPSIAETVLSCSFEMKMVSAQAGAAANSPQTTTQRTTNLNNARVPEIESDGTIGAADFCSTLEFRERQSQSSDRDFSAQRVQIRGDVTRLLGTDAHVRHRIPRNDLLRMHNPISHVLGCVAQHAGDVDAFTHVIERGTD